jgi:predicted acyl esterase
MNPGGPGVATYDSEVLTSNFTMIGRSRLTVEHSTPADDAQLNARLYDVFPAPDNRAQMVDRGVRRMKASERSTVFDLNGNGWRFPKGNFIRIELAQDDDPYVKRSVTPSWLSLTNVTLQIPIQKGSMTLEAKCR